MLQKIRVEGFMNYRLARLAIVLLLTAAAIIEVSGSQARSETKAIWTVPEIGALPRDAHGLQVREGRDLTTATYAYLGPNVPACRPANNYPGSVPAGCGSLIAPLIQSGADHSICAPVRLAMNPT